MKNAFLLFFFTGIITLQAQTLEELQAILAIQKDSLKAVKSRVDATQGKIDAFPGWKKGAFGTIGGSFSNFNNWYAQKSPNNRSGNIGFTGNAFANLDADNFFWRNSGAINLSWVKFDDKDVMDTSKWREATDVFNISSLYGLKLNETLALSGLGEYRTTILNNFNNPGYLDAGIGATWTPIKDLVVVAHPLNYNLVLSRNDVIFKSSFGTKILVDYTRQIKEVSFKTNLSMFQSYKSSNFSNWTWNNTFGYTLWKMIGVGFDFGLRSNKQEALKYYDNLYDITSGNPTPSFENIDNKLQSYYTLGLSYKF
ncbi:hypothetical protein APS56_11865 [Pseudalgibacter alginicilyticus]|uniref:DUF3078 domain-containing protein n=1 Tax=Pseudalgibacter alginicilyticus TaxID=1736674 RepID=A0A0P0CYT7_9FLAO|nr:DUF3078 domain-containing protein [Pseudalgibacter alginicilyticus]ALJ05779.1 hypothetical protein APS56_11865 [Pseudalgibacter alginicilyticus]